MLNERWFLKMNGLSCIWERGFWNLWYGIVHDIVKLLFSVSTVFRDILRWSSYSKWNQKGLGKYIAFVVDQKYQSWGEQTEHPSKVQSWGDRTQPCHLLMVNPIGWANQIEVYSLYQKSLLTTTQGKTFIWSHPDEQHLIAPEWHFSYLMISDHFNLDYGFGNPCM